MQNNIPSIDFFVSVVLCFLSQYVKSIPFFQKSLEINSLQVRHSFLSLCQLYIASILYEKKVDPFPLVKS